MRKRMSARSWKVRPGYFFFSSRRRHTRFKCDWSSDVCSSDLWNKGLPYLDGIEVYHLLPFSPELGSAILSGRVDYARALDPATARKAAATPGLSTAKFYQSVIHATWLNAKRPPFYDPRVRRAIHMLVDNQVLLYFVKHL